MKNGFRVLRAVAYALALLASGGAQAQAYPERAIRWVVPYPPGGSTDILTRIIGQKMNESWGQPVVVENRGGASGIIGVEAAAKAAPDGYTLLMTASGPHAINPSLFPKVPYDPLKSFSSITLVAKLPMLLLVHPGIPANNVREFVAWAKAQQGKAVFASIGSGTPSHLAMELFKQMAGVELTHVPYKGSGPALTALIGGQEAPVMFDSVLSSLPHVKSGKLKAIAVSTAERLPALPDVPTLIECGIPFELVGWHAMFAPAGTPRDIVERLNRVVNQVIAMPDVRTRIFEAGSFPVQPPTTVEQWGSMFRQDVQNWAELVRASGATIN